MFVWSLKPFTDYQLSALYAVRFPVNAYHDPRCNYKHMISALHIKIPTQRLGTLVLRGSVKNIYRLEWGVSRARNSYLPQSRVNTCLLTLSLPGI